MSKPLYTVRASSLSRLFDCSLSWYFTHIRGLRIPSSGYAHVGRAVHKSAAVYDQATVDRNPITVEDASDAFMDALRSPDEEIAWGEVKPAQAERTGIRLQVGYCSEIAPTREYYSVEQNLGQMDIETEDATIRLTGTPDRIRRHEAGYALTDLKTGGRCINKEGNAIIKSHVPQLGVYELLAEHNAKLAITGPSEIVGLQTTRTPKRGLGYLERPRDKLVGTAETPGMIEIAARILKSGSFAPNTASILCGKYCPAHRSNGGPCVYAD